MLRHVNGWGTSEERYRRACMAALLHRYLYYVLGTPALTDGEYDQLEAEILLCELFRKPHPRSPTQVPGSDSPLDYPQSLRWYVHHHLKYPLPGGGKVGTKPRVTK